ncbi:hypothetical protein IHE45_13G054700 [Dioscorea alata]|uniref:Uncharacterized protein n=1 Tax=Dioscorea alata TaxID=55571 RepID=A0ACB7UXY8_DIOAL|nr:hypothetical protein IHE45_13G054700 [Dioscorea alata]
MWMHLRRDHAQQTQNPNVVQVHMNGMVNFFQKFPQLSMRVQIARIHLHINGTMLMKKFLERK